MHEDENKGPADEKKASAQPPAHASPAAPAGTTEVAASTDTHVPVVHAAASAAQGLPGAVVRAPAPAPGMSLVTEPTPPQNPAHGASEASEAAEGARAAAASVAAFLAAEGAELAVQPATSSLNAPAPAAPEPTLAETAAALAERFPALFAAGQPRPIKLRVQADIQQRAPGVFTKKQLSIFLHRHTTSTAYIRALVASGQRFDLDGEPAGEVAAEHMEAAKAELERRRQIVMQRRLQGRAPSAHRAGGEAGREVDGEAGRGAGRGADRGAVREPGSMPQGAAAPGEAARPSRRGRPRGQGAHPAVAAGAPGADSPDSAVAPRADRGHRPDRPDRPGPRSPHAAHAGKARRPGHDQRPSRGPQGSPRPDAPGRADRPPRPRPADPRGGPDRPAPPRPLADRPADHAAALPEDPGRRERALLLRSFEGSPLTAANFCALKGLSLGDFEAQIALARRERDERAKATGAVR